MATIAIVDDNPDNLKLVEAVLRRAGHQVATYATGVGFAAIAEREPPNLILLDLGLPDVDGIAVLAELRRLRYRGRIVALTAHATVEDRALAMKAGFDGFIPKPLDIATFPVEIQNHLI